MIYHSDISQWGTLLWHNYHIGVSQWYIKMTHYIVVSCNIEEDIPLISSFPFFDACAHVYALKLSTIQFLT